MQIFWSNLSAKINHTGGVSEISRRTPFFIHHCWFRHIFEQNVYIRGKQTRDKRDIRVFGPEMSLMGLVMFAYEHFVSVAEIILENCDSFITIYSN